MRHPTPRLLPILFQSLFFWIHFYNIDRFVRGVIDSIVFQSLFFWIHFYNDEDKIRRTNTYLAFQSLFFWIHFYNPGIALPELYQVNVSILVFLDSLLQRIPLVSSLPPDLRFNPCFSGFTSTTRPGDRCRGRSGAFQSLFFWIHFYNGAAIIAIRRPYSGFNPCFSGFTSTTFDGNLSSTDTELVSILVFLDSLLQLVFAGEKATVALGFQSLFFWIHFYNPTYDPCIFLPFLCFNPCFSGFTSTTRSAEPLPRGRGRCFNPCFSGFTSTTTPCLCVVFYCKRCFNPCFSGFTSTTPPSTWPPLPALLVSILVFLDSLLQHHENVPIKVSSWEFQSLFFWIHFYNRAT